MQHFYLSYSNDQRYWISKNKHLFCLWILSTNNLKNYQMTLSIKKLKWRSSLSNEQDVHNLGGEVSFYVAYFLFTINTLEFKMFRCLHTESSMTNKNKYDIEMCIIWYFNWLRNNSHLECGYRSVHEKNKKLELWFAFHPKKKEKLRSTEWKSN